MRSELTPSGRHLAPVVRMLLTGATRNHYAALAVLLTTILVAHLPTFLSMAKTWVSSDTFLHGALIFPISLWLLWLRRGELARMQPSAFVQGAAGLLLLSFLWWSAKLVGVQVVQQLAVVGMLVVAVVTVLGPRMAVTSAFPLGYLFFAVPVGEALVPHLIDYTAAFTVEALEITGIPVFRDGRYFSIPAGNFEVARACSGIRYLLAALALGTLFAYVMFDDMRKRVIFVLFSIVMPIVASGLRAYGIVLIAELVGIDFATGVDHFIVGWIFFGLIIGLMFFVGSRFSDHHRIVDAVPLPNDPGPGESDPGTRPQSLMLVLAASVVFVAVGPALAAYSAQHAGTDRTPTPWLPAAVPGWTATRTADNEWRPRFLGADLEEFGRYVNGDSALDVVVVHYRRHDQGGELANSENRVADTDIWRLGNQQLVEIPLRDGSSLTVTEVIVYNETAGRAIWYWFSVGGRHALTSLQIKLLEAASLLKGVPPLSSAVIVSTDLSAGIESSRAVLRQFAQNFVEPLSSCMHGNGAVPGCGLAPKSQGSG